jgi:hypothetical protein
MEDYLNYMNSVSESESVLNQVNAIKENIINQAEEKVELKDQLKEQITGIPSEMLISTAGAYLGKKAITYAASKLGVSEEAVGKVVSGDIEGGLKQGLGDLISNNMPVIGQGTQAEELQLQGPTMEAEQGGDIELQDLSPPSQEEALGMLRGQERPAVSAEDLPEGAGGIEEGAGAGQQAITDTAEAVNATVETAGETAAETAGTAAGEVGAEVGAEAGLEAAGAALDVSGIGAVAGAFLGLIGGLVGLFEGSHHDAPKIVEPYEPLLNPSSQIL